MSNTPITSSTKDRFLAVDALRTVALFLLIVYHVSILFQPWSKELGWMQNDQVIPELWLVMSMLNVWRIPILFWLSGMGVRFAMERRDNKELLKERTLRIFLPWAFGFYTFGPMCVALDQYARGEPFAYIPTHYHLWFLLNMFAYVIIFLPVLRWVKNRPNGWVTRSIDWLFRSGWFVPLFALPYMLWVPIVRPEHFSAYAETNHGFYYGAICFLFGYLAANTMESFQAGTIHWRWRLTFAASLLWALRIIASEEELFPHHWELSFTALESMWWMLAILGHAFHRWNDGFTGLKYWNVAVYPVYIFHQPLQNALALFILTAPWNPWIELLLLIATILLGSILLFEATRRMRWVRPLVGLRFDPQPTQRSA